LVQIIRSRGFKPKSDHLFRDDRFLALAYRDCKTRIKYNPGESWPNSVTAGYFGLPGYWNYFSSRDRAGSKKSAPSARPNEAGDFEQVVVLLVEVPYLPLLSPGFLTCLN
jgi:hypothetical protein